MSPAIDQDVLARLRTSGAASFEKLGWPAPRAEEWKYTNLAPARKFFEDGTSPTRRGLEAVSNTLEAATLVADAAAELVFINGTFQMGHSKLPQIGGIRVWTIANAPTELLDQHLGRYARTEELPIVAINAAHTAEGAVVEIEGTVEGFVHLLYISTEGAATHPRNLVVVRRAATARIIETYTGTGVYATNAVTEIAVEDGAVVEHCRLEDESKAASHLGMVSIHQDRSSSVTSRSIALGGQLVRNETRAALAGEGASLVLDGLYVLNGNQHVDNHTVIDHCVPHCESVEVYKGVLDDQSRGVFDGKIVVRPGAKKTVSRQTNKNLLLAETAIIDSKPTLEIFNDDVKCNHGSTIGQLEEEPLFYLRSRGIGEEEARGLLIYAFASEIVDRIHITAIAEQIRRLLFRQMPGRMPERRNNTR